MVEHQDAFGHDCVDVTTTIGGIMISVGAVLDILNHLLYLALIRVHEIPRGVIICPKNSYASACQSKTLRSSYLLTKNGCE